MNDEKLYNLCKKYGAQALEARRKFAGLLPEVFRRKLFAKKNFGSIFEFAAKLAGMSEEQVRMILNLEKKFEDKPVLREMLVNGEVSANKLVRVASIATSENEEELAEKVKLLPKSALDTLVRDEKIAQTERRSDLQQPLIDEKSLPGHSNSQDIGLDVKILQKLSPEVKQKLVELTDKGIDINEELLIFLENRKQAIAQEKEQISKEVNAKVAQAKVTQSNLAQLKAKKPLRYIPIKIKRIIQKEHGTKCAILTCKKESKVIHHTNRFALTKAHDPKYMAPFCDEHHKIAHTIDIKYLRRQFVRC